MVEFAASGSGTSVPGVRAYHFAGMKAGYLTRSLFSILGQISGLKRILESTLKWSVLSRALTGIKDQCLMYTNQFITLKARHFA